MIDRDSYPAGSRGYDEFVADARGLIETVRRYAALDAALEQPAAASDTQRMVDMARRALAATAVDELGTLADIMADVARELGAPIEDELRAAKRLIDMSFAESTGKRLPRLPPVETTLFDPRDIPEFASWRTKQRSQ